MSKFFAEDVPENVSDEEQNEVPEVQQRSKVRNILAYDLESESEEEEKRVVRSEKEKRYGKLKEIIRKIQDKININDFFSISDLFEELNKELEKSKKVIAKEGIPKFYIKICFMLENLVN